MPVGLGAITRETIGSNAVAFIDTWRSPVALDMTGAHTAWVKLVNLRLGLPPLAEIQINAIKHH